MNLKKMWENYKLPTPQKWRRLGDLALLLIPAIHIVVGNAPENTFTVAQQYWLLSGLDILLILFKFWTNTNKVENI